MSYPPPPPRPMVPPRPSTSLLNRSVSNSRLTYPRLLICEVGFYSGPPIPPSVIAPSSAVTVPPFPSSGVNEASSFQLENNILRMVEGVRSTRSEELAARAQRLESRLQREQLRLEREAADAAAAAKAREEALEAERQRRLKQEEEDARDAAEVERLRQEEAAILARKQELERKAHERLARNQSNGASPSSASFSASPSPAVVAPPVNITSASSFAPTPSQLAFERSFQELTGITNSAQVSTLLLALQYDLDRAIAIFFSEDPPSMITALEKARSIQQNAQQQQQHQHQASQAALPPSRSNFGMPPHPPSSSSSSISSYSSSPSLPSVSASLTKIDVLLPDGTPILVECLASDTFWTLYERLSQPLSARPAWANKSISFALVNYPHTTFDEQRFNISMREAGLVPRGTLKIQLSQ